MDRPKMIAAMRIGMVGSMDPVGVNCSSRDRCPHWKIHTTTPNVAPSDSTFITIAFRGRTTDPKARNSSTNVDTQTSSGWMVLYGAVAMEVFGHIRFALEDPAPMFELTLG